LPQSELETGVESVTSEAGPAVMYARPEAEYCFTDARRRSLRRV